MCRGLSGLSAIVKDVGLWLILIPMNPRKQILLHI